MPDNALPLPPPPTGACLRPRRSALVLLAVWAAVMVLLFRPIIHGVDPVAYYSWVRSAVIEGTLDVSASFAHYDMVPRGISPTGYRLNEWPVGAPLLWAPFFLLGHLAALAGGALGLPWAADGYSPPYLVATGLASALYALLGLWWLYRLCCRVAPPALALAAVLTAWLATPLVFYASAHPFMAHAADFFIAVLFWRLLLTARSYTWRRALLLGLAGGLAACVRLQSITLLLWPAAEILYRTWRPLPGDNARPLRAALACLAALAAGALLGFGPQIVVWRVVFGQWLIPNVYGVVGAGTFDWRSPHFLDVLFASNRGLFLWTPAALLALWGLLRRLTHAWRRAALLLLANLLVQVYVVGSWSAWSGAAAFGQRFLVSSAPAWAMGLSALYAAWSRSALRARRTAWAVSGLLIAWNLVLLARYALQDVPRMGPVPLAQLVLGQFTFVWSLAGRAGELLAGLLRRLS